MISRRRLLTGVGALLAAPAIVKFESIMPVRNRLYVPMMFGCYIKNETGTGGWIDLMQWCGPNDKLENLGGGAGWFKWSTTREVKSGGGKLIVKLPANTPIWGAQFEFANPGLLVQPGERYDVAIQRPDGGKPLWLTGDGPGCVPFEEKG